MRRLSICMLAMMLLCTLLAPTGLAAELSEVGVLPLIGEPVTLTVGLSSSTLTTDYHDNYATKLIEEATGVTLDFMFFPSDGNEAKQKLAMMVAAGEKLPDILIMGLSDIERLSYGASGYFLPLNDYIDEYAFYWNQSMDEWATEKQKEDVLKFARSPDGNIYGYPQFYCDPADACALYMSINTVWLENLGLDIPTTTDELYAVLKAFKEQDANGNGDPNDEIPLIGHKDWMGSVDTFLMNSFVYDAFDPDFGYQLNVSGGELNAPFTTDAYREGLRYMNMLFAEELLSPLSFSMTSDELRAIMTAPNDQDTLVGVLVGHPSPLFGADGTVDRVQDYVGMLPLIGPEGVQYAPFGAQLGSYNTFITVDCENPELAFRMIDAIADTTLSLSMRYGEEGVDWQYVTEGKSRYEKMGGYEAIYEQLPNEERPARWTSENNTIWHINNFNMLPPYLMGGNLAKPYPSENREYQMGVLCYDAVSARYNMHPDETSVKLIFTQEEIDEINEIEATLRSYVDESKTGFILGTMNVETDWERFLSELEAIGLSRYIEVAQGAYDRLTAE